MKKLYLIVAFGFFLLSSWISARSQEPQNPEKNGKIYVIVKDAEGEAVEGFIPLDSEDLKVRSRENQEKSIPLKLIKSISLEKMKDEAVKLDPHKEATYKVELNNSQEILTLHKKYTLNLNTNLGMVTKTIDPDSVNRFLLKEPSQASKTEADNPFIKAKSVLFSLEVKF